MCSFDVSSLFTNVPLDETIEICLDKLYALANPPRLPRLVLKNLLLFATKKNHIQCFWWSILWPDWWRRNGLPGHWDENHNAWLQAFPSFPSPTPSFVFLLWPHFSHGQDAESHVSSSLFALRKRLLRRLVWSLFRGKKWLKNRLVCKNAVALAYYRSCRLPVMGSWP